MSYDSTKGEAPFSLQLRPSPDVLSQRYDDSVVLLNLNTDRFFHLNRTGARFWELLGEQSNLTEIHEAMSREFDIEGTQLAGEMTALITELREQDLVKVA
jgi:hypothetical protein